MRQSIKMTALGFVAAVGVACGGIEPEPLEISKIQQAVTGTTYSDEWRWHDLLYYSQPHPPCEGDVTPGAPCDTVGEEVCVFIGHPDGYYWYFNYRCTRVWSCNGLEATVVGTNNADTLNGTAGHDVIVGLGGDDIINGLGGDDTICGGAGNDTIYGGAGNDTLFGEGGNDVFYGSTGTNYCHGGPGTDGAANCQTTVAIP